MPRPSFGSVLPGSWRSGCSPASSWRSAGTWLRVLGTAGLLTLFVDLQFDWFDSLPHLWVPVGLLGAILLCWLTRKHLSRVVTAIFAAMLAPTVALYALGGEQTSSSIARTRAGVDPAPANGLPTIVHIILDEHIGIEGIPDVPDGRETKALIKSFFRSHGFRLFGHAYSRYADTRNSIPSMLNYTSQPSPGPGQTVINGLSSDPISISRTCIKLAMTYMSSR